MFQYTICKQQFRVFSLTKKVISEEKKKKDPEGKLCRISKNVLSKVTSAWNLTFFYGILRNRGALFTNPPSE